MRIKMQEMKPFLMIWYMRNSSENAVSKISQKNPLKAMIIKIGGR